VIFATRSKKHGKYYGFRLPRRKKHPYLPFFVVVVVEVDHASDHTSAPRGAKGSAGI